MAALRGDAHLVVGAPARLCFWRRDADVVGAAPVAAVELGVARRDQAGGARGEVDHLKASRGRPAASPV